MKVVIKENAESKVLESEHYNFIFNKQSGFFARWGKTKEEDPVMSPFGPEIADIEISTNCCGPKGIPCTFCYKANTATGERMSIENYNKILGLLPKTMTQVALGIGDLFPELSDFVKTTRDNGYVPNITTNGRDIDIILNEQTEFGAISVSNYDKDVTYDAVQKLIDYYKFRGIDKQVNIHQLYSNETYDQCWEVAKDFGADPRLKGLNAIVFLFLKEKGRAKKGFTPITDFDKTQKLFAYLMENKIPFGNDSCGCGQVVKYFNTTNQNEYVQYCEPCESSLFSIYINVKGEAFPCSFIEGTQGWERGIDMLQVTNFQKDVWYDPRMVTFRTRLLHNKRNCPVYKIGELK